MAMIYEDRRPVLVECRMKILKSGGNTDICLFALNWLSWFRVFVFSAAPCPIGPGNTPRCPDRWDSGGRKKHFVRVRAEGYRGWLWEGEVKGISW